MASDETSHLRALKGMYADIIATQGDPLEDISALKKVTFVMKCGAIVKGEKK